MIKAYVENIEQICRRVAIRRGGDESEWQHYAPLVENAIELSRTSEGLSVEAAIEEIENEPHTFYLGVLPRT